MNHDLRIGQRKTLAFGTGHQQERPHAGGHAHTQRRNLGFDELHGVENRHAGADAATGRVDIERNVLVRVLALQKQQLGHHKIGGLVVYLAHQKDHALLEQTRINFVGTLTAARLLDDHRNHAEALNFLCAHVFSRLGYVLYPQ